MTKSADLHVHTNLSDGTFSPERVVEHSKAKGLDAIAITDHDCCKGIDPAIIIGRELDVEIIPGVELTAELEESEVHILGYFIDWQNASFVKKLDEIIKVRNERAKEILRKLREYKIDIQDEELFGLICGGSVGRLHIAQLMVRKGFVRSIRKAFKKYIGDRGKCYVRKFKLSPKEAVDMIKDVGGVAVLAHPNTVNIKDKNTSDIVSLLVKDGIQGIEVYHSEHKTEDENKFKDLAEKYNLLITGGSDCHGFGKSEVLIGKVKVPYKLVEELKKVASKD